ncbi:response regulator [Methylosinus sp. H3A]|uniref:ATP-binding protein n=1 Tax=Methylosinus sp. H3A TaxID=2785786 RepID=UPI0018C33841|nr:ATP-binding protein [Methylosinus sp. H3A]MBG0812275.1 response regulator [Methylosinus sp. H3A]
MPPVPNCVFVAFAFLVTLVAAGWLWFLRARRALRRRAVETELEGLRDEIWELRAAAAARDRAEAASQAKSRFLATVSHEIRTPLNGVLGLAQLLAATRLDAEQASYVDAIAASGRSLAQLIDDILDFSKIEAGKIELEVEPFALTPLVEGVVELLAPRAQAKHLEIASYIAPDAPETVAGDAARVRQILVNLAGNAVNFTASGGVGLSVERDAKGALVFRVADTGPGVAPAAREIIFEEFEQGDGSSTRRHGGTGLGLAISRHLAALMGGRLEIEEGSGSSSGAVFAFTLPRGPHALFDDRARERKKPLAGSSVLIVSPTIFEGPFMAEILRGAGAQAEIARDEARGADLLGAATEGQFDCVVVDCAFGEAATERLADEARRAGAGRVFLMFSPMERRAFGEAALRHFDGWLVKPVRAASLVERLSTAPPPTRNETGFVAPAPTLAGRRVLVAEDNDVNALIVCRHLEKLGALVTRAEDGARAVELARTAIGGRMRPFDVILMDVFMPELDGLEATRLIRAEEARMGASRRPIVALTASALEEDERAARGAGVDFLLTKPVEFDALSEAILEAIEGSRRRAAGAREAI